MLIMFKDILLEFHEVGKTDITARLECYTFQGMWIWTLERIEIFFVVELVSVANKIQICPRCYEVNDLAP